MDNRDIEKSYGEWWVETHVSTCRLQDGVYSKPHEAIILPCQKEILHMVKVIFLSGNYLHGLKWTPFYMWYHLSQVNITGISLLTICSDILILKQPTTDNFLIKIMHCAIKAVLAIKVTSPESIGTHSMEKDFGGLPSNLRELWKVV